MSASHVIVLADAVGACLASAVEALYRCDPLSSSSPLDSAVAVIAIEVAFARSADRSSLEW